METDDLNAIAAQLLKLESQVVRLKRTVESFGDATKIQSGERLEVCWLSLKWKDGALR